MEKTKIQLSEHELHLMQNSDWILTKNNIIEKISQAFGDLAIQMQHYIMAHHKSLDESIVISSPKISRGEKYRGLPYVILDYPRIFGKQDILAIRTLFWWGNYCSITLHTKGFWKDIVLQKLLINPGQISKQPIYISFSGDEWNHSLDGPDYTHLSNLSRQQLLEELPAANFLKLVSKVEIGSWIDTEERLYDLFPEFVELIKR